MSFTVTMGSPNRRTPGHPGAPYPIQAGGIRKRASTTANTTLSAVCPGRLYQAALDGIAAPKEPSAIPAAAGFQWITPQQSPQPDTIFHEPSILDSFPHWTAPTPPHSDSGLPSSLSFDPSDGLVTAPGIDLTNEFAFDQSASADMSSSLGFLLPSQYGAGADDDDYPTDNRYQIPPVRLSQSTASSSTPAYAQPGSSSPSHYQSRPSAARTAGPSIPPINHSPLPSPHPGGPSYPSAAPSSQSRSLFDPGMHPPPPQRYPSSYHSSQPPPPPAQYAASTASDILHKPAAPTDANARAMNQRPKPQCWEHGCNGRQFSTFSNLLRHQREKSGTSSKSYCPKCGAEFTRTTARNGHLAHDKCTKTPRPGGDEK